MSLLFLQRDSPSYRDSTVFPPHRPPGFPISTRSGFYEGSGEFVSGHMRKQRGLSTIPDSGDELVENPARVEAVDDPEARALVKSTDN